MATESAVNEALASAQQSAVHLEMRDVYNPGDPDYADWQAGNRFDPAERWRYWFDLVKATVDRGVPVRRARIVGVPISDYIRYEYDVTAGHNLAAGEQVRWLDRRHTTTLALPGVDFWLLDGQRVIFNHFDGDGTWLPAAEEDLTDASVAALCSAAFEAVWARAVPHHQFRI